MVLVTVLFNWVVVTDSARAILNVYISLGFAQMDVLTIQPSYDSGLAVL